MQNQKNVNRPTINLARIIIDAVFAALYFCISMWLSIRVGNIVKITWCSLPILLAVFYFGFTDGLAVALIGTFFEQLFTYGLMPTTIIWMLPGVIQVVVAFVLYRALCGRGEHETRKKLILITFIAEFVLTIASTGVSLLDGYLYDYFEYMVAALPARALNGLIRAILSSAIIPMIVPPVKRELKKNGVIS